MSKNKYKTDNVNLDKAVEDAVVSEATSVEETSEAVVEETVASIEEVKENVDAVEASASAAATEAKEQDSAAAIKPSFLSKRKISLTSKRAITGYMFILPWLVGFCLYYVRSLFMTIQFSFSEVSVQTANSASGGAGYNTTFTWFDNFKHIFGEDPKFNQNLILSLEDIVIDVPLVLTFALLMAILLNQKFFGRTIFRAIFFIPVIMSCDAIAGSISEARQAAIGGISSTSATIAEESSSTINLDYYVALFKDIGLPAGVIDYVVGAVGRIADVVDLAGVQIVIFIAALQSIPSSLYEVAKIEGATTYETFWKVTFPMVMPHIITCLVYTVVNAFADSEVVQYSYDTIFGRGLDYDYGSAMALVSMIVVCILLFTVVALIQRKTFYYN